jgi:Flp pilus assembly protein TadD
MEAIAEVGRALAAHGDLEAARDVFETLTALEPHDADAHATLATLYTRLARFDQALAAYAAALRLDPSHVVARANRGELRLARGDDGGLEDLEAAARADSAGRTREGRRARTLVAAVRARPDALARRASSSIAR